MFDSDVSASSLIAGLKTEIDVSSSITNATYVIWLNTLEQLLYSEVIKEQDIFYASSSNLTPPVAIDLTVLWGEATPPKFEDIVSISIDDIQLKRINLSESSYINDAYWKVGNLVGFNSSLTRGDISLIFNARPALKTVDDHDAIDDGNVMLPYEHLDLMRAKLRGEAYKLVNEDSLAAKWLQDYNTLLDIFKAWVASRG